MAGPVDERVALARLGDDPACGVVESMPKIERHSDVGGQYIADIKVSRGVTSGASGTAIAANAVTGKGYEITVRFATARIQAPTYSHGASRERVQPAPAAELSR